MTSEPRKIRAGELLAGDVISYSKSGPRYLVDHVDAAGASVWIYLVVGAGHPSYYHPGTSAGRIRPKAHRLFWAHKLVARIGGVAFDARS